jgi:hypothetical protein
MGKPNGARKQPKTVGAVTKFDEHGFPVVQTSKGLSTVVSYLNAPAQGDQVTFEVVWGGRGTSYGSSVGYECQAFEGDVPTAYNTAFERFAGQLDELLGETDRLSAEDVTKFREDLTTIREMRLDARLRPAAKVAARHNFGKHDTSNPDYLRIVAAYTGIEQVLTAQHKL